MRSQDLELVTISWAAGRLGCAPDTVKRWADGGQVPVVRLIGGTRERIFRREDIERLASQRERAAKKAGS